MLFGVMLENRSPSNAGAFSWLPLSPNQASKMLLSVMAEFRRLRPRDIDSVNWGGAPEAPTHNIALCLETVLLLFLAKILSRNDVPSCYTVFIVHHFTQYPQILAIHFLTTTHSKVVPQIFILQLHPF